MIESITAHWVEGLAVRYSEQPSALPQLQLYRHPHDVEMLVAGPAANTSRTDRVYRGDGDNTGHPRSAVLTSGQTLPEVYRLLPDHQTPLSPGWVRLWKAMNPDLSVATFGTLLGNHLAWTNYTGWPGRYNCLTGANKDERDPAFDAARVCGGALLKGAEWNGILMIQSLLLSDPVPAVDYVLDRPWLWYWGTQVAPSGNVTYIQKTGMDGKLHPVRVPLVTDLPVYLPLAWLDKLPLGFVPVDGRWMP